MLHLVTLCLLLVSLALPVSIPAATSENATLIEGAKKEGSLVFYTSMTADQAQRVLDAFRVKYPFVQPKIFRAVGERLLTKIMTEAQTGRYEFDVVQSAESQAYFLKKKNLLLKYISPEIKNIRKPFYDPDGYWAAVYIMPNVIAYNTQIVKPNEVPRTDDDLLNPKWKGKIAMDGTKPEWFAWKLKRLGRERGPAYMKKLGAQDLRLYPGLSLITNLLAAGEFPLVLNTYLHNVEQVKRKGGPVDWTAQDPVFTKFQPVGIGARAPHPNAAKLFTNFIFSEQGQKIIASLGRIPTRVGVTAAIEGIDKLNYVIDDIGAGDDFNNNFELFRATFGVPQS